MERWVGGAGERNGKKGGDGDGIRGGQGWSCGQKGGDGDGDLDGDGERERGGGVGDRAGDGEREGMSLSADGKGMRSCCVWGQQWGSRLLGAAGDVARLLGLTLHPSKLSRAALLAPGRASNWKHMGEEKQR